LKTAVVLGTRPEIIKMSPVIRELEKREADFFILHTGQHYSYNLDKVFFEQLKLPQAEYNNESGPIILDHEENREILIGFQPTAAGNNQKVEFLLYRQGQSEAYRSLYILINVKQAGS